MSNLGILFVMKCPGCQEKVHEEELVDGSCPLCGEDIKGSSNDYGDTINEIVSFFEDEPNAMAINIEQGKGLSREMTLHKEPTLFDRVKPKKCSACGRWHIRFGDKQLELEMKGSEGEISVDYYCILCEPREE